MLYRDTMDICSDIRIKHVTTLSSECRIFCVKPGCKKHWTLSLNIVYSLLAAMVTSCYPEILDIRGIGDGDYCLIGFDTE